MGLSIIIKQLVSRKTNNLYIARIHVQRHVGLLQSILSLWPHMHTDKNKVYKVENWTHITYLDKKGKYTMLNLSKRKKSGHKINLHC